MTGRLAPLLAGEREAIVETVFTRVRNSNAEHYRDEDARLLRARVERLVDAFIAAAGGRPAILTEYMRGITLERIREGYHLREVQLVLSILEAKGWEICAHRLLDREELLGGLALLTGTVGAAKDELARVYLEERNRAEAGVEALERRVERLMSGTV